MFPTETFRYDYQALNPSSSGTDPPTTTASASPRRPCRTAGGRPSAPSPPVSSEPLPSDTGKDSIKVGELDESRIPQPRIPRLCSRVNSYSTAFDENDRWPQTECRGQNPPGVQTPPNPSTPSLEIQSMSLTRFVRLSFSRPLLSSFRPGPVHRYDRRTGCKQSGRPGSFPKRNCPPDPIQAASYVSRYGREESLPGG